VDSPKFDLHQHRRHSEIIDDMKNGILVPVSDIEIMSQKIIQVLNDHVLASKLSQQGIRRAKEFSAEKIASLHTKYFEKILL